MAKSAKPKEDIFIPDVPAQMEEELQSVQIVEDKVEIVEEVQSDEISFLKKLLDIQHSGGWGRHLDDVINLTAYRSVYASHSVVMTASLLVSITLPSALASARSCP